MEYQEIRNQAARLLTAIWRGIPADYKSRYRMTIWTQFENQVRSAAYTNNLAKFINQLCLKLSANCGITPEERAEVENISNSGKDREILKLLRDETVLIVLMVRVDNQERREAWEISKEADKKDEGQLLHPENWTDPEKEN
jgi:hypothetical protein